ncbi:GTPase HflX [Akkermansia sp. N21169]|jgi:GTP-binding protein HflX|uniref:GTPase HflX n=1 Tax=Akkermansia sp. N21169 TaxID=3040765 RepID=UPI00244E608C|nr:GTPase HflX [Akkermansia sp. N21169]MDH3068178.1 GTPase HflX [Akkermansia sp. N21169]
MFEIREKPQKVERALLVSIYFNEKDLPETRAMLEELDDLVSNLDIQVVGKELVRSREIHAKFLCGTGKAQEICDLAHSLDVDCVVFDNMLAPSQQREWERLIDVCVIDREEVILDIFAQRARTREATLQVDLARMQYSLPRMARMWAHLDRQGGGSGGGKGGSGAARGEGEKQIEVDRRLARSRIEAIQKELEDVRRQRATQRKDRERQGMPTAAIVGYTNAGKSSLLSFVSGADVMAKDMLFATLDTTTRKISLPDGQALLLTDTVGFIRNLPHRLVEAFKSTLEEAVLADFLIQVVDVSDPDAYRHFETTLEVLAELGAVDKPMVVVFNKLDKLEESVRCETAETLARKMQMPTVSMSVRESWGMDDFMEACVEMLSHRVHTSIYKIPQYRSDLVAVMHREGKVLSTEYEENDIIVQAILPRALDSKLDDWKV